MKTDEKYLKFHSTIAEVKTPDGKSALRYRGNDEKLHYIPTTEGNPSTYFAKSSDVNTSITGLQQSITTIKSEIEKVVNALKAASFEGSAVPQLSWVSNVYSITYSLGTHQSSSNPVVRASKGSEYKTIISNGEGYTFGTITVKMGGVDQPTSGTNSVVKDVTGGKEITIKNVAGDLVITVTEESVTPAE